MANELRIAAQLEYNKNSVKESKNDSAFVDVSGESYNKTIQVIGTSNEQISVASDIGTYGYMFFKNLDATNYVEIADEDAPGGQCFEDRHGSPRGELAQDVVAV